MAIVKKIIGNVKGPQGVQGDPGERGPSGASGIRGSRWVNGDAISGENKTPNVYSTGISDALVDDQYLNIKTGNLYRCTKAGDQNTAQWVFEGNISNNTLMVHNGEYVLYDVGGIPLPMTDIIITASPLYADESIYIATCNQEDAQIGGLFFSNDGNVWNESTIINSPGQVGPLLSVAAGKYAYIAVGHDATMIQSGIERGGIILTSSNGDVWDIDPSGYNPLYPTSVDIGVLNSIHYANNRFVAVGEGGTIITHKELDIPIQEEWIVISSPEENKFENFNSVTYGNGIWVAVGDNFAYSEDEAVETWNLIDLSIGDEQIQTFNSIAFGNGRFVAVGDQGSILYSDNAISWHVVETKNINRFNNDNIICVKYVLDGFMALCDSGIILNSVDGTYWKVIKHDVEASNGFKCISDTDPNSSTSSVFIGGASADSSGSLYKMEPMVEKQNISDIVLMLYKDYLSRTK